MEKIVYDYLSRRDVIHDQMLGAIERQYKYAYPKPDLTFKQMCEKIHKEAEKLGKQNDANFRLEFKDENGKSYMWPIDFYYIPEKVSREIWDNSKEANGIENYWQSHLNSLIEFLFVKPGMREVYSPTEWSDGKDVRHCEDQYLLKDIIGDEAAEKVKQLIEEYKNTYHWDSTNVNQFSWGIMSTPCTNRETVKKAWKCFGKDIEIPSDDTWIDKYDYEDMLYEAESKNINGED